MLRCSYTLSSCSRVGGGGREGGAGLAGPAPSLTTMQAYSTPPSTTPHHLTTIPTITHQPVAPHITMYHSTPPSTISHHAQSILPLKTTHHHSPPIEICTNTPPNITLHHRTQQRNLINVTIRMKETAEVIVIRNEIE